MPTRVPLRQYRLHVRDAYVDVSSDELVLRVPSFFGAALWRIPNHEAVAADLTTPPPNPVADRSERDEVFVDAPNVPYLFTTGPMTAPTLALLFRTPQRTPVLTRTAAFAPNVDIGVTRRQTRSAEGAHVDGVLLRCHEPMAAMAQLRSVGIEETDDADRWLVANRPLITDPTERSARIALEERLFPRHRTLGWAATGGVLGAVVLQDARPTLAVVLGAAALVAFGGQFLITRCLRRD